MLFFRFNPCHRFFNRLFLIIGTDIFGCDFGGFGFVAGFFLRLLPLNAELAELVALFGQLSLFFILLGLPRSEERRVGKEGRL